MFMWVKEHLMVVQLVTVCCGRVDSAVSYSEGPRFILWRVYVLETPFGLLLWFIYNLTSRHYNYFLQCSLFTSVLILYLGWSSDCWHLGCYPNLTPLICVSDRFLWSAALTLRLRWSPDVASLIGSFWSALSLSKSTLLSRSSRTGARTPCPRVVFCFQLSVG
jgi:hypothetical protein